MTGRAAAGLAELLAAPGRAAGRLAETGSAPGELLEAVAERTGYLAELQAEHTVEAAGRIENIDELVGAAAESTSSTEFLEEVSLVADADEVDDDGAKVSLMTLHTAKGLEFPAVFIVGMEDGVFPHLRSLGEPDRDGGGAAAGLRGHHPGPGAACTCPTPGAATCGGRRSTTLPAASSTRSPSTLVRTATGSRRRDGFTGRAGGREAIVESAMRRGKVGPVHGNRR